MNKVAQFFDRQSERFGPSGVLPHHEARAQRLRRIVGEPPLRVLELGCGSGGAATACARMGYEATARPPSPVPIRIADLKSIAQAAGMPQY